MGDFINQKLRVGKPRTFSTASFTQHRALLWTPIVIKP